MAGKVLVVDDDKMIVKGIKFSHGRNQQNRNGLQKQAVCPL